MEYNTLRIMIKYKRKSKEELKNYCAVYLASGKITADQHKELIAAIQ